MNEHMGIPHSVNTVAKTPHALGAANN